MNPSWLCDGLYLAYLQARPHTHRGLNFIQFPSIFHRVVESLRTRMMSCVRQYYDTTRQFGVGRGGEGGEGGSVETMEEEDRRLWK